MTLGAGKPLCLCATPVVMPDQHVQVGLEDGNSVWNARDVHLPVHTRLLAVHALLPRATHPDVVAAAERSAAEFATAAEALLAICPADPFILRTFAGAASLCECCLRDHAAAEEGPQRDLADTGPQAPLGVSVLALQRARELALNQLQGDEPEDAAVWFLL